MKHLILCLIVFTLPVFVFGQHLWNNPVGNYVYNPSSGAMSDLGELVSSYYKSYGSATNSPMGVLLMGSTTFPNDNVAAGFRISSESGGVLSNLYGELSFIYRVPLFQNSKLSFGLSGTFNQMTLQKEKIYAQHPDDPLLQGGESGFWGDVNSGVSLYRTNVYYIGVAGYNLARQQTNWLINDFENQASRYYTLTGMYTFNIFKGDWKWELSGVGLAYEQKISDINYDLSSRFIFKKSFWLGGGYTPNAVKGLFGIYFQNLAVGYAGSFGMGDVKLYTYSMTQHEIFVRLELNTSKPSRTKKE